MSKKKRKTGNVWTQDNCKLEKELLRRMKLKTPQYADFAREHGMEPDAVRHKAQRLRAAGVVLILLLCCLVTAPVRAENNLDPAVIPAKGSFSIFGIGNENEIGGGFLYQPGDYTAVGLDGRWYDTEGDTWSLSGVVLWNAVPTATIPLGGLFPQADLPIPASIDIGVNLGGRLGIQRNEDTEEHTAIAALIAEAELNPGKRATLAIRYEYAFSEDVWNELPADPKQHQAFLCLKYRF